MDKFAQAQHFEVPAIISGVGPVTFSEFHSISQLCEQYGIRFVETEEANTSAASFLDGDSLPKHGEKPDTWKSSGKRVMRGLFRTANNWYVNADAQAAANIINKVAVTLGLDLSEIGRGSLTTPQRIKLWSAKQKREAASVRSAA